MTTTSAQALLRLLQLTSPALPVGAYSYSEGLETLVDQRAIATPGHLVAWLEQELASGMVAIDSAAVALTYKAATGDGLAATGETAPGEFQGELANRDVIAAINRELSALRDSEETRQQSWDMGRSLVRMATHLHPDLKPWFSAAGNPCNFAVAFALVAARWQIDERSTVLGYLHSWAANLITSAVKLVPLGQTVGQEMLLGLYPALETAGDRALSTQALDKLALSSWGTSLATMQHEALYTRLFRS